MDMPSIPSAVAQVFSWLGSAVTTITSNELLLIPFGVAVVGAVVGVLMRVFSGGRA